MEKTSIIDEDYRKYVDTEFEYISPRLENVMSSKAMVNEVAELVELKGAMKSPMLSLSTFVYRFNNLVDKTRVFAGYAMDDDKEMLARSWKLLTREAYVLRCLHRTTRMLAKAAESVPSVTEWTKPAIGMLDKEPDAMTDGMWSVLKHIYRAAKGIVDGVDLLLDTGALYGTEGDSDLKRFSDTLSKIYNKEETWA